MKFYTFLNLRDEIQMQIAENTVKNDLDIVTYSSLAIKNICTFYWLFKKKCTSSTGYKSRNIASKKIKLYFVLCSTWQPNFDGFMYVGFKKMEAQT